ncbi:MAG: DUF2306 domain-containing protein [Saprospiraceae bacterium]|nr:DUF2306 domain-containing protein [Saprospiraceae bacterium]
MKYKKLTLGFLLIGAISMLIMSTPYFETANAGILKYKILKDTPWYRMTFLIHILFGLFAILSGPLQFMGSIIRRKPIHKTLGYIYTLGVFIASISGLVIAQFAMGGITTQVGFSIMSLLWFSSLIIALQQIYAGNIKAHKRWMTISYAITFSAITQRSILLLAFIPTVSFMPVYQLSSWLSWMINLTIVLVFMPAEASRPRINQLVKE